MNELIKPLGKVSSQIPRKFRKDVPVLCKSLNESVKKGSSEIFVRIESKFSRYFPQLM